MGDETANSINLNLSLDFTDTVNQPNESLSQEQDQNRWESQLLDSLRQRDIYLARMVNLEQHSERLIIQRNFRAIRHANRIRRMTENLRRRPENTGNITSEFMNNPVVDPSSSFLSEEARVIPEERDSEFLNAVKNNSNVENIEEKDVKGNKDKCKDNDDDKCSLFDCNICFDVAKDPIVTCCGHLFCWACVYQWLNLHSIANECPVCKGKVTMKTLTPIYGRGISTIGTEQDQSGVKIPARPHAKRDNNDADVAASRRDAELERERETLVSSFDDMDSLSTLAAVLRFESQSLYMAHAIDSDFPISLLTSRGRNEDNAPVISNVVRGDSRDHRRRRLN